MLGIYCRISKEKEEGKDRSINDQKKSGIELAKKLAIPYKVFIDEGVSGTLPIEKRPSFSNLLDEIEENKITHLYAYDQSRLERSQQTRMVLIQLLKDNNVRLFTENGELDLHNDEVEMLGDIMSVFNSYYVRQTKKKIKSVLLRNVIEGRAHSSILPYGYKKDDNRFLAIDEDEAEIVKRIYELSLSGTGTNKIAEIFNLEGVLTRYNKIGVGTITTIDKYSKRETITNKKDVKWAGNTIINIIKNTIYKGKRKYNNEYYNAPVIIEPIYWQKVNDNLKKNRNNSGKKVSHKYLLKGLIICGFCGRNYYGRTRVNKKDNYYMCSSKRLKEHKCKNKGINIDFLENQIINILLDDKAFLKELKRGVLDSDENSKIKSLNKKLTITREKFEDKKIEKQRAITLVVKGVLTEEELVKDKKRIEGELNGLKRVMEEVKEDLSLINSKEEYLKGAITDITNFISKGKVNHQLKYDLIRKFIKKISVKYENKEYKVLIIFQSGLMPILLYQSEGYFKRSIKTKLKLVFNYGSKLDTLIRAFSFSLEPNMEMKSNEVEFTPSVLTALTIEQMQIEKLKSDFKIE